MAATRHSRELLYGSSLSESLISRMLVGSALPSLSFF
jgi:hypothetical protein